MTGFKVKLTTLTMIFIFAAEMFGEPIPTISSSKRLIKKTSDVDLRIDGRVSPDNVAAGGQVTYTYTVTNQSSVSATDVILLTTLEVGTYPVSAGKSASGCSNTGCESCEDRGGKGIISSATAKNISSSRKVLCHLGNISTSGSVVVIIVAGVSVYGNGISTQSYPIETKAEVTAQEKDSDMSNNSSRLSFTALPSMNKPPLIGISAPAADTKYFASSDGTATIPVRVTASDSDGAVRKVEIYDTGDFVGNAVSEGEGNYVFNIKTKRFGYHVISATAVDNEDREGDSQGSMVVVNSNKISIISPAEKLMDPGTDQMVEARSDLSPDKMAALELYDDGIMLGMLKPVSGSAGNYLYRFNWLNVLKGRHSLRLQLMTVTGAQSFSDPVNLTITNAPKVSIISIKDGAVYLSGSTIKITAEVSDADGYIDRTDFIANDTSIGNSSSITKSGSKSFDWTPLDGVYTLYVSVTDDLGIEASSRPVKITVK